MAQEEPDGPATIRLPTFVIGPRSQGRGYRVLPPSADFPGSTDLAMLLMEWARTGETRFVGRVALPDSGGQSVVFRAARLGEAGLGELAYMQGVVIDAAALRALDHRPETVLDRIPEPDGSVAFALTTLPVTPPAPIQPSEDEDSQAIGLAWRDRLIVVDHPDSVTAEGIDRSESILLHTLASISPAEQRERVTGWITSGRLEARGRFNLLRDSQLIIAGEPYTERPPGHLRCDINGSRFSTERAIPPPSWLAREAFRGLLSAEEWDAVAAIAPWRFERMAQRGQQVVEDALLAASGVLPVKAFTALLFTMMNRGEIALRNAAYRIISDYIRALSTARAAGGNAEVTGAADEAIKALVEVAAKPPPDLNDGREELARTVLTRIDPAFLASLEPGFVSSLAGHALDMAAGGELADAPQLRSAILALIERALACFDGEADAFDTLTELVRFWPEASETELLPLTRDESFRMILAKSEGLGAILSTLLRPQYYADEVGDTLVMQIALDAERTLGAA